MQPSESRAHSIRFQQEHHSSRLGELCKKRVIPLADICRCLKERHFADEVYPNEEGAKIIVEEVFIGLNRVYSAGVPETGCPAAIYAGEGNNHAARINHDRIYPGRLAAGLSSAVLSCSWNSVSLR